MDKVVVAMSGGVDSSVAAAHLVRAGYKVIGVTLRLWSCEDEGSHKRACCGLDQVAHARGVADKLAIPHYVIDESVNFDKTILRHAWNEYSLGRTPNPCILCNEHIKFGALLKKARALGARWIATGHYARIRRKGEGSAPILCRGDDLQKDQSYFLFSLTQEQLDGTLFPIGELTKQEVRRIAHEEGFQNADRAESQDACLLADDGGFAEALRQRYEAKERPGTLVDADGNRLGEHPGVHRFTVGQRRGLGIALGQPAYVSSIDAERNEVTVSTSSEDLMSQGLEAADVRWSRGGLDLIREEAGDDRAGQIQEKAAEDRAAIRGDSNHERSGEDQAALRDVPLLVQIRYRHRAVEASVSEIGDGRVRVRFDEPQKAVTPGQAAVFYKGDCVIGGGWIRKPIHRFDA